MTPRTLVAVIFLAGQVVLVVASQFGAARWFNWAPHSSQVQYTIVASADGRPLDAGEVSRRFGLAATGWEAHAVRNVQDIIVQYARTHGRDERLTVELHYSVNGRPGQVWTWPADAGR
ncbi:MAG TPA: hypothetical protein VMM93_10220 [Vicinamibacterales bacterium]|nr:hypothetical protein [Vicinamibacterales bacterium]